MKKQMVGGVPGNVLGMFADLMHKMQHGGRTPEELAKFLKGENPFVLKRGIGSGLYFIDDWSWIKFYQEVFNLKVDLSGLRVPARQKGFDRLIVVAPGMTSQRIYDKCTELFPCWKWTDKNLDEVVRFDRTAQNGPYAIWVRDRVEADEELKNLSANKLKQINIPGITLEERFLYELKFFKETEKHLDIDNVTLCVGSRDDFGDVPSAYWCGGKLRVRWYDPDDAFGCMRSRQAVS